jgi:hypothetical protein
MSEMLLINPRRKRRHARRRAKVSHARRNPRRRRSAALAVTGSAAPARKRSRRRGRKASRRSMRRSNSFRSMSMSSFLNSTLIPAGVGAAGALGVDLALKYANPYLPAFLQTGIGNSLAKIAGAVGVGYIAGKALGKAKGEQAMAGAITVTLYDLLKQNVAPALGLSGYNMGWISPALQVGPDMAGLGVYDGSYQGGNLQGLGGMGVYVGDSEASYYANA